MGVKNADHVVKGKGRVSGTVPNTSGNYMEERITFGAVGIGEYEQSFMGVTVLIESIPASASVELWLPRVTSGSTLASDRTDADYYFAGLAVWAPRADVTVSGATASYGAATWSLAGYPGAQLRVRSGGVGGAATFSASAF